MEMRGSELPDFINKKNFVFEKVQTSWTAEYTSLHSKYASDQSFITSLKIGMKDLRTRLGLKSSIQEPTSKSDLPDFHLLSLSRETGDTGYYMLPGAWGTPASNVPELSALLSRSDMPMIKTAAALSSTVSQEIADSKYPDEILSPVSQALLILNHAHEHGVKRLLFNLYSLSGSYGLQTVMAAEQFIKTDARFSDMKISGVLLAFTGSQYKANVKEFMRGSIKHFTQMGYEMEQMFPSPLDVFEVTSELAHARRVPDAGLAIRLERQLSRMTTKRKDYQMGDESPHLMSDEAWIDIKKIDTQIADRLKLYDETQRDQVQADTTIQKLQNERRNIFKKDVLEKVMPNADTRGMKPKQLLQMFWNLLRAAEPHLGRPGILRPLDRSIREAFGNIPVAFLYNRKDVFFPAQEFQREMTNWEIDERQRLRQTEKDPQELQKLLNLKQLYILKPELVLFVEAADSSHIVAISDQDQYMDIAAPIFQRMLEFDPNEAKNGQVVEKRYY